MILFKEDWSKYPTAIVDYKTTNKSFLEYAEKLRLMGIENHLFCLSLLDPMLQGVDPHDPLLSTAMKARIFLECKHNIWYYLREVHRIVPVASSEGIPFRAHRGNIAFAWCCMLHVSVGLTLPRQTGKSIVADAVMQWAKECAAKNTTMILVTKDMQLKDSNIKRLKAGRKLLPPYIANISKKDADNTIELTNVFLGNRLTTVIGQASIDGANKAARGLTAPIFSFDEAPFTNNIKIMVGAALPAYIAASAEAKKYGFPHWVSYTTTAGKIDSRDGKFMYDVLHNGMWFTEHLYDCKDSTQARAMIRRQSTGDDELVYINFQYYQLGYSDKWLFDALAKTHSHGADADRDYFNIWTNGTSEHPLAKNILDSITGSRTDTVYLELFEREYVINWYITKNELNDRIANDKKMIAGIDTSEGIGKDFITMTIIAEEDLSVLGTFAIRETNTLNFIEWITELVVKYPNLILIPENKSTGVVLIDGLLIKLAAIGIDPFKRIYNRIVDDNKLNEEKYALVKEPISKRPSSFYESNKTMFGYRTAGSGAHARTKLYVDALQKAGAFGGSKVRDSALISEISSLSVKDGRLDHTEGNHDDRVISWLLAVWFLSYSKNLHHYGIKNALRDAIDINQDRSKDENISEYEIHRIKQDEKIRMEIAKLLDDMHKTDDAIAVDSISRKIRTLEDRLINKSSLPKSIDELIKDSLNIRQARISKKNNEVGGSVIRKKQMYGAYYVRGF